MDKAYSQFKRVCPLCKEEFTPKRTNQIYCSSKHQYTHRNWRNRGVIEYDSSTRRQKILSILDKNDKMLTQLFGTPNLDFNLMVERGFHPGFYTHLKEFPTMTIEVPFMFNYGFYFDTDDQIHIIDTDGHIQPV